ncbi:hypothetical protein [Pseudoxanthomonas sp. CF125]|uniref:hypothetical protein n=1 Tax=Pseudoxanthomonas sp. CF125 TaxID=1855303 RepID=UPI00089271FC|nr:hypothetical protein [Pseudoxanthomonas sp. CF125]SDQ85841.1 hypothetical protein SAMN05216569_2327 [Pseudoxanthomonas sp. CF125]
MSRKVSAIIAIAIGGGLALLLTWCWAYIAAMNPLPSLLAKSGLRGAGFWTVIASTDFLINVILCLPAAWALWRLGARHIQANTLLALVSFAIAGAVTVGLPAFSYGLLIWITYLLLLASLPVAVWMLSKFIGNAPDNSFKPKPLRGSA